MLKEKAADLANTIKETEEYKNLKSAEIRVKLDPSASDLINELNEQQTKMFEIQQKGEQMSPEIIQKLELLQSQFPLNQTLQHFIKAQDKFAGLMEEVNKVISENLSM